jgi:hypothetical protein
MALSQTRVAVAYASGKSDRAIVISTKYELSAWSWAVVAWSRVPRLPGNPGLSASARPVSPELAAPETSR